MFKQRFRLQYSIGGDKRFLSHHDLMRLWLRALRRSDLPLRMSEGFHVRPRVSFAMARGVAVASQSEWLEFELSDWVTPDTVHQRLAPQLPRDIAIRSLQVVPPQARANARQATYVVRPERLPADIDRRIADLMARDEAVVLRGKADAPRHVDIRPLLVGIEHDGSGLTIVARCGNEGTLKQEEVLRLLGFSEDEIRVSLITRTELRLDD